MPEVANHIVGHVGEEMHIFGHEQFMVCNHEYLAHICIFWKFIYQITMVCLFVEDVIDGSSATQFIDLIFKPAFTLVVDVEVHWSVWIIRAT